MIASQPELRPAAVRGTPEQPLRSRGPSRTRRQDFEGVYLQHRDRLFAFLVVRTGDRALAEDLLGDVFERAFRARAQFDPRRGTQTTWLYRIALNRLTDHQRRLRTERVFLQRAGTAKPEWLDPPQDAVTDRDLLKHAVALLSDRDREILALRFAADHTVPQIARLLDLPLTAVEGRLFRALGRLRKLLEPRDQT